VVGSLLSRTVKNMGNWGLFSPFSFSPIGKVHQIGPKALVCPFPGCGLRLFFLFFWRAFGWKLNKLGPPPSSFLGNWRAQTVLSFSLSASAIFPHRANEEMVEALSSPFPFLSQLRGGKPELLRLAIPFFSLNKPLVPLVILHGELSFPSPSFFFLSFWAAKRLKSAEFSSGSIFSSFPSSFVFFLPFFFPPSS